MHNKYSVVFILKRVGLSLSYKKGLTNIKQYCTYWGDGSLSLSHIWRSVCHSWHGSGSSATQSRRRSHHQHSGTCPIQDNGIWCYFPAKCCEHNSLIHENKKGPATHVWNMYKWTSKCRWSWWADLPGAMLSTTQSKQNIKCTLMI